MGLCLRGGGGGAVWKNGRVRDLLVYAALKPGREVEG
jgi:hypothetical protein